MKKNIKHIFELLLKEEKKKFFLLICAMVIAMLLETIGIASIIPLINILSGNSSSLSFFDSIINNLGIEEKNLIQFSIILIFTIYLFKNIYLSYYYYLENKFAYKTRFNLGSKLYNKYLERPFSYHSQTNSSVLITKIVQETSLFGNSLMALSSLITESLIIVGVLTLLLIIKPYETLIIIFITAFLGIVFFFLSQKISFNLGKELVAKQQYKMKILKESLSSMTEIIVFDAKTYFKKIFLNKSMEVANYGYKMSFLNRLPKVWFELAGVIIISAILLISLLKNENNLDILGTIGIFLLSSLKIIPSINKIVTSLQLLKYSETANKSLYDDFSKINKKQLEENIDLNFKENINLENLYFKYQNSEKLILEDVNLKINKGDFIAIIGESGSGKTTLMNLLMGLLEPTSGKIYSDNIEISKNYSGWRKKIGFVPQNITLLDESLKKNIAYGLDQDSITYENLKRSIKLSQLSKFVVNTDNNYDLIVGEGGAKISGGQKQRIGIARALYHNPQILIFDEPTSYLDKKNSEELYSTLKELNKEKTIIVVSHDTKNLDLFEKVYEIDNRKIKKIK